MILWVFGTTLLADVGTARAQVRSARALRAVQIESDATGWTLDLEFEFAVRYLQHSPQSPGRTLRIQVDPLNLGERPILGGPLRESLPIPKGEPSPLLEIVYDTSLPLEPAVEIHFGRTLAFSVEQAEGLRGLRIRAEIPENVPPSKADDDRAGRLLSRARDSIRDGEFDLAIALLTRVLELPKNEATHQTRMDARELIALTHERLGQLAHAQSEYEAYLEDHPDGPAAERVRQRLDALITASDQPRKPLRRSTAVTVRPEGKGRSHWRRELFGSLETRFFRAKTLSDDSGGDFLATNLLEDVDIAGSVEADTWALRGDFTGTYDLDVAGEGRSDDARISRLSIRVEDRVHRLEATVGRQRRSDSGVLGRFDGLHAAAEFGSHLKVSALVGLPVESTSDSKPNVDTVLAGGAVDFEDLWIEGLQGQFFVVGRQAESMLDRTAIGGEIRFIGDETYSFAYFDYDVVFDSLNTFMLSNSYRPSPDTDFRILIERRNSPVLTLRTALQGQTVQDLEELKGIFSENQIRDLALDRTAVSWSGTAGASHRPHPRYQVSGDLTVGYIESTKTSGGVQGSPSFGPTVSSSLQLLVNDWLLEGGIASVSIRYFEGDTSRSFMSTAYSRFTLPHKLRLLPRIRWEWRDSDVQGSRSLLRPSLETNWRYESLLFNGEMGLEWEEPISGGGAFRRVSYFLELGIRWEF
ncbi:MAG: hypothetical protein GY910_01915 [bacterium]|nr:hypothetical protein [bacterium]